MTTRISRRDVDAKVDTVNRMLGFNPDTVSYGTMGAIQLYGAYGSWAVHQVTSDSGGTTDLHGLGTLREAATFLNGMIASLNIVRNDPTASLPALKQN